MKKIIADKFLLLITAVFVGAAILGLFALLDHYHFSMGWQFFIGLSVMYVVVLTKFCLPFLKRARNKKLGFMLLISIEIIEIAIAFCLCYFNILPLPERRILLFGAATTIPGVITVRLFEILLEYFNLKRTS